MIEGWDIDAVGQHGIEVRNTDAHFVVRSVSVHTNNAPSEITGIWLSNVANTRIESVVARDYWQGIRVSGSANVTIVSSLFASNLNGAAIGAGSVNITVEENTFVSNADVGVAVSYSSNVWIASNAISGSGYDGISVYQVHGITLADNAIDFSGIRGITLDTVDRVTAVGNRVSHSNTRRLAYGAVIVLFSANGTIEDNRILLNDGDGMQIYAGSRNMTLSGNTFADNLGSGLWLDTATAVRVFRNDFLRNGNQARDSMGPENDWDDGYVSGGNFWGDYAGPDNCSGPNQDVCPDPDGIGDTPYVIDGDSRDRYPLVPLPPDSPPSALLAVNPPLLDINQTAEVTANGSFDVDGLIVGYNFSFGDGVATGLQSLPYAGHAWITSGFYQVGVTVTDDRGATGTARVSVCVGGPLKDLPPVAVISVAPDVAGNRGTTFTFNGTASSDDLGIAAYYWNFGDGANATSAVATHSYTALGNFSTTLTVRDTANQMASESVVISIRDRAPIAAAVALPGSIVNKRTLVTLDASGSGDPDASDTLTYAWTQTSGPLVLLTGAATDTATFAPAAIGTYAFTLAVDDGHGETDTDTVTVTVLDLPPVADIASDVASAEVGVAITFDGANSWDADGVIVAYAFDFGDAVAVSGTQAVRSHAYGAPGEYRVTLTVTDDDGSEDRVTTTVTVREGPGPTRQGVTVCPWFLVLPMVLVILVLLWARWKRRRRQAHRID